MVYFTSSIIFSSELLYCMQFQPNLVHNCFLKDQWKITSEGILFLIETNKQTTWADMGPIKIYNVLCRKILKKSEMSMKGLFKVTENEAQKVSIFFLSQDPSIGIGKG